MAYNGIVSTVGGDKDGVKFELGRYKTLVEVARAAVNRGLGSNEVLRIHTDDGRIFYLESEPIPKGGPISSKARWICPDQPPEVSWDLRVDHPTEDNIDS